MIIRSIKTDILSFTIAMPYLKNGESEENHRIIAKLGFIYVIVFTLDRVISPKSKEIDQIQNRPVRLNLSAGDELRV